MKWGLVILGMLAELNGFMIESSAESVMHQIYGAIYIGIGAMLWCSAAIIEAISPANTTGKKPAISFGSTTSREEFYRRQGTPPPDPERDKQDATIMSYLDDPPKKK